MVAHDLHDRGEAHRKSRIPLQSTRDRARGLRLPSSPPVTVCVTHLPYTLHMRKSFRYRLYPTRQQTRAMLQMLDTHRHLYNRALAERKDAWEQEQRSVHYEEQSAQLKSERTTNPYLAQTNFSSCQATLRRLKKTFEAFFRRVKAGEKAGYPRFKGRERFDTVAFPSYGDGCKIKGDRAYFQHIGEVRIVLHRPIEGTIKTVSFTRRADDWYLIVSCDLGEPQPVQHSGSGVGIDVGLEKFATLSTGEYSRTIPVWLNRALALPGQSLGENPRRLVGDLRPRWRCDLPHRGGHRF